MDIPQEFTDALRIDFQDRLRARYSGKQQAVVIEQRVGRNILPSLPRKSFNDERRQSLAEGYLPIMTVAVSEVMRCPSCRAALAVPNRETREITCLNCKLKGRRTSIIVGYYPLNHFLIHHLKSIDPMRNMDEDMVGKLNEHNERLHEQQTKKLSDDAESYANDNINKLMQIPTFSYAGVKIKEGTEVKAF